MAQPMRDPMVTIKHSKTKGEGRVPLAAVRYYENQGWTADAGEVREASKVLKGGGETTAADSKQTKSSD